MGSTIEVPTSFEGWEVRYAIVAGYDREFPAWGRTIRAAFATQFPGATITIAVVPEVTEALAITSPEGIAVDAVAEMTAIAERVLEELGRRAVGESRHAMTQGRGVEDASRS